MVTEFLAGAKMLVDVALFDVAGPIISGHVKTTNLPWVLDEKTLAHDLDLKAAHMMNDLEVVARAVPALGSQDANTINRGEAFSSGPIAIIAPGTSLGESFLTWNGSQYLAHGSEGGHSDFARTDEHQIRLLHYLLPSFGHVGVERVCSGIGVAIFANFRAMKKTYGTAANRRAHCTCQRSHENHCRGSFRSETRRASYAWQLSSCLFQYWQARLAIPH